MTNSHEIDLAIDAHRRWASELHAAICACQCATPIDIIRRDDQCMFGQWLYSDAISPTEKNAARFRIVHKLHREFHRTAAKVVELAQTGQQEAASVMMQEGGEYPAISGKLINAMEDWKKILRR